MTIDVSLKVFTCFTAAAASLVKTPPHAARRKNAQARGKLQIADATEERTNE
jgi:hypothetical protein